MRGPCAKRAVECTIITPDGRRYIGRNDCENPQPLCPREPGEGYEKCQSICKQAGHAEREAVKAAGWLVPAGSMAILTGHYWMCEPCGDALRKVGITQVVLMPSK